MTTRIRAVLIAGAAAAALSLGTAGAMAATAERPGDDGSRVQHEVGATPGARPVPASTPGPVAVRGTDDPAHDAGDDHGDHGDPAAHDAGDDHAGHGTDD